MSTDEELIETDQSEDNPTKRTRQPKKGKGNKAKAVKESDDSKKDNESLRRVVLNPFKRASEKSVNEPASKGVGDILKKVSAKPKTVKQRIQNVEALKEFNENHEDDMFGEPVTTSKSSLKFSKSTLLSQDPDSDSDNDISVHSARTPVTGKQYWRILIFYCNY